MIIDTGDSYLDGVDSVNSIVITYKPAGKTLVSRNWLGWPTYEITEGKFCLVMTYKRGKDTWEFSCSCPAKDPLVKVKESIVNQLKVQGRDFVNEEFEKMILGEEQS